MKKFSIYKHESGKFGTVTAENLRAAKLRAQRYAGITDKTDYAWRTADRGVHVLYVITNHRIVRGYTLRPA